MNVLFLSLLRISTLQESNIYTDLLREFVKDGDNVIVISPIEKRFLKCEKKNNCSEIKIINPNIGNITNTPFVEKGISSILFQRQIISCIKKEIPDEHIDLFILATPPVNANRIVRLVKKHYGAKTYLLLKDIWPASINDLRLPGGMITKTLVSLFFRGYEIDLYKQVDAIACMSEANMKYVLEHNKYITSRKVHINPNAISIKPIERITEKERLSLRSKYGIPKDELCFVYGGTLGIGQNVPHIIDCLKACRDLNCSFLIIGNGVQYYMLENYMKESKQENVFLLSRLPKDEYLKLMQSCDVGLVFLRYSAQTPNFPSRILSYMEYEIPILSCTDPVSDLNETIRKGKFGYGCLSNNAEEFKKLVIRMCQDNILKMGKNGRRFLEKNYSAKGSMDIIKSWYREVKREEK